MARAIAIVAAGLLAGCAAKSPSVIFVADFNLASGSRFETLADETVGGISAVTYDEASGHWLALSDARTGSRFYELAIVYRDGELQVTPVALTRLLDSSGEVFDDNVLDPEGIAESPWGTLFVSTEADSRREPIQQAKLLEFDPSGRLVRRLELPSKFVIEGSPPQKGVRDNMGFESLTVSADGTSLFVGGEAALLQDGPEVTFEREAFCRIVRYRVSESEIAPSVEYAYPLGPVPRVEGLGDADLSAGLVELVSLTDTRLLALERDFIRERTGARRGVNRARLFLVDIGGATDVSELDNLTRERGFTPVRKKLLLDFDDIVPELSPEFRELDNFEAMGLGPELPDGGRSLLVVSDDNFSERQRSAFLLFSLKAENE